MSDQFHTPEELSGDLSLDELLRDAKAQLGDDEPVEPAEPADAGGAASAQPVSHSPADDFTPDFGDAFDDYGEYNDAQEPLPMGDYEDDYDGDYPEDDAGADDYEDGADAPPPQKPKRRTTKRVVPLFVKILLYVVIVGLIAVGFGYGAWECAQDVLAFGRSDDTSQVTVRKGETLDEIADMLKDEGFIKYPWLFKFYCKFTHSGDEIEAGTYTLSYNYDYHALIKGMVATSPNRTEVRVTIPEGLTAAQIFSLLEQKNVCTVDELEECAANTEFDYWFLEGIPYGEPNRLEGFLFPDTYDFYEHDDPERALNKLLVNFNRKFSDEAQAQLEELNARLSERLHANGYDDAFVSEHLLSVSDLVCIASMIEKETAGATESANISSVIFNRLCRPGDYPYLNIDAALVYALGGSVEGGLTDADKQVDSPYNTYTHAGLPAGPISNPGLSSIAAALNPAETDYYFYALDNSTGYHHFSRTYEEHNQFLGEQNNG